MYAGTVDRVWRRAVQGSRGVLHECCITASIVLLVHVSELTVRIRLHAAGPVLTAQCSRGQQPTVQLWWMRAGSH